MKRKIVLIFLATLTISMLSGCGNSQTANSETSANTQTESEVLGDKKESTTEDTEISTSTDATETEYTTDTNNAGNTNEKYKDHSYYLTEWGTFDYGWEEAGITREEDLEDGFLGFTVHKDEGEEYSYLTYNKDGTRYDVGDRIPTVSGFNGLYLGADMEEVDRYMKDPNRI